MPRPLSERDDTERILSQSRLLGRLRFTSAWLRQGVAPTVEQTAVHETYLTWIEPLIEYDSIDVVVNASRRWLGNRNKDDETLVHQQLQSQIVSKSELMSKVVQNWIGDEDLRQRLQLVKLQAKAVSSYDLFKEWGQADPDDAIFIGDFYDDWVKSLDKEDEDRSFQIARCIVVLLKESMFCDVSRFPNLQLGIKNVITYRNRLKPERPIDLT